MQQTPCLVSQRKLGALWIAAQSGLYRLLPNGASRDHNDDRLFRGRQSPAAARGSTRFRWYTFSLIGDETLSKTKPSPEAEKPYRGDDTAVTAVVSSVTQGRCLWITKHAASLVFSTSGSIESFGSVRAFGRVGVN
jgi:hypothetical protein